MSYIKIELGGKERGLKFNAAAEDEMRLRTSDKINFKNVYALFYAGLIGNCAAKDIEPDFEWEEVTVWVDELMQQNKAEVIDAVGVAFEKSQEWKKLILEEVKEDEKKSNPEKKSKKKS